MALTSTQHGSVPLRQGEMMDWPCVHQRRGCRFGHPHLCHRDRASVAFPAGRPPVVGDNGIAVADALVEVAEARPAQAPLHSAQTALTHANRVAILAELSATIAHEVNQPLATIVTRAETGLRWLLRDQPNMAKVEQLMRHIVSDARRASDIVQCIRGMVTKHESKLTSIDLSEVVD